MVNHVEGSSSTKTRRIASEKQVLILIASFYTNENNE